MEIRKPIIKSENRAKEPGKIVRSKKPISKQAGDRIKKKRNRKYLYGTFFIAVFFIFILVSNSSFVRINNIVINSADSESESQNIKTSIDEYLGKKHAFVLSNNNIFYLSKKRLSKTLFENHSDIEDFSIRKSGLHNISIDIKTRTPVFKISSLENTYIGTLGYVYKDSLFSTTTINISESEFDISSGQSDKKTYDFENSISEKLDEESFSNLLFATKELKNKNFFIREIVVHPYNDASFIVTDGGGEIRVNLLDNQDDVFSVFSSAKKVEPLRNHIIKKLNDLEYIDLRFGNKVFFKFKNEN